MWQRPAPPGQGHGHRPLPALASQLPTRGAPEPRWPLSAEDRSQGVSTTPMLCPQLWTHRPAGLQPILLPARQPCATWTDTVNGRQQAARRLTIYSVVTSGLGRPLAGEAPAPCAPAPTRSLSPAAFSSATGFPTSGPGLGAASLAACRSPGSASVSSSPWQESVAVWTAAALGLLSLFDLRGSFLESSSILLGGVLGEGRGELVLMGSVGTFRNLPKSRIAAFGGVPTNCPWARGDRGWGWAQEAQDGEAQGAASWGWRRAAALRLGRGGIGAGSSGEGG